MKKLLLSFAMLAGISLCIAQTSGWQNLGDTVVYTYAKVGINTPEPKEALHVNGYARGNGGHGAFQIRTEYGITAIGADSPGYSHFDTNKDRFYFTKPIMINGGCISSSHDTNLRLQTFHFDGISTNPTTRMTILNSNGNVGIGKLSPQYKLDVAGGIRSDSIKTGAVFVESISGADFVFDNEYKLPALEDVRSYIQAHGHLPSMQSAKQMQQEGVDMSRFQIQLLQKIEELTLYIIQQEERIRELEKHNTNYEK